MNQVPAYLADVLLPVTDLPGRRRLRSSSASAVVVPSTRLDTSTATRLRRKIDMLNFYCVESLRMEAGARDKAYCSRIVILITSVVVECVVVSSYATYRSLVVVESQL